MKLDMEMKNLHGPSLSSREAEAKLGFLIQEIDSVNVCPYSLFTLNISNQIAVLALISNYLIILINFKMVSPVGTYCTATNLTLHKQE